VNHLVITSKQRCAQAPPQAYWASIEECIAAVVHLRESLFLFYVTQHGTVTVELVNDLHPFSGDQDDVVETVNLDRTTAYMVLATLLRNHVIPLAIAKKAGTTVAHFTALRVNDSLYDAWTRDEATTGSMRSRYKYPTIPERPAQVYDEHLYYPASASCYSPTSPSSLDTSDSSLIVTPISLQGHLVPTQEEEITSQSRTPPLSPSIYSRLLILVQPHLMTHRHLHLMRSHPSFSIKGPSTLGTGASPTALQLDISILPSALKTSGLCTTFEGFSSPCRAP
jgi:hypothetical protein